MIEVQHEIADLEIYIEKLAVNDFISVFFPYRFPYSQNRIQISNNPYNTIVVNGRRVD